MTELEKNEIDYEFGILNNQINSGFNHSAFLVEQDRINSLDIYMKWIDDLSKNLILENKDDTNAESNCYIYQKEFNLRNYVIDLFESRYKFNHWENLEMQIILYNKAKVLYNL